MEKMTNLTPRQLEIISELGLGKTRNIQLGLDLHAELFIYMRQHKPELNDNVSAFIREALWHYLSKSNDDIARVVRDTIRQEIGKIKVVSQEVSEDSDNGTIDDSEGFFS